MKRTSSFGRKVDQRNLLLRSLATSVILYESVITSAAKAQAIQPIIDRLIRTAQTKDKLIAKRQLHAYLLDENAITKVLEELVPRFEKQTSGFTRRLRLPARLGDGSPRVMIQLTKTVRLPEPDAKAKVASKAQTETTPTPETNEAEVSHE